MSQADQIHFELLSIELLVNKELAPLSRSQIKAKLGLNIHDKTLQRRLKTLVDEGRIQSQGSRSGLRYMSLKPTHLLTDDNIELETHLNPERQLRSPKAPNYTASNDNSLTQLILSRSSREKFKHFDTPSYAREKTHYDRSFIETYIPNKSRYLSAETCIQLHQLGKRFNRKLAAGTYAKNITQRLLIDLSYNSSRLEGNTYSILETQRLLELGEAIDGKFDDETVMLLNHKEAILFLIENAPELSLNSFVIRNLHQILAQDLLPKPESCGQLRKIDVKITQTSYTPLSVGLQLEEAFQLLLRKASQILDPFEQSFFLLIHISYLQAFEDINKRTARLSCNLPFIQENLCPLSFIDVPKDDYIQSMIYFYETGDHLPMLEVFIWAYQRSSQQYQIVEESLGSIDSYRILYRVQRKQAIGEIIHKNIVKLQAIEDFLSDFCHDKQIENPDKFIAMTLAELDSLHTGALIALGVTERSFLAWQQSYLQQATIHKK